MLKSINNTNLLVNTSPSLSDVTTLINSSISSLDTIALRNTAITTNNATNLTLSNTYTNYNILVIEHFVIQYNNI